MPKRRRSRFPLIVAATAPSRRNKTPVLNAVLGCANWARMSFEINVPPWKQLPLLDSIQHLADSNDAYSSVVNPLPARRDVRRAGLGQVPNLAGVHRHLDSHDDVEACIPASAGERVQQHRSSDGCRAVSRGGGYVRHRRHFAPLTPSDRSAPEWHQRESEDPAARRDWQRVY